MSHIGEAFEKVFGGLDKAIGCAIIWFLFLGMIVGGILTLLIWWLFF